MTIMATLFAHRISKGGTVDERKRSHQMYFFQGHQVCRYTFCFAFGIGKSRLQAIGKSIYENGFRPRVHGLCSSTPKNSLSTHERRLIKMFISRYANDNALPLPGRLPNCPTKTVLLLPSDKKIADIHDLYEKSAHEMECRHVSLRTFRRIWTELCPHISIAKPTTDLCQKCQKYAHSLTTSGQFCEEEKATLLSDYQGHIENAKLQRDHYRAQTLKSKELNLQMTSQYQDNQPCSFDGTYHYSWDYAQQVHYPHHSQQVGPIFFKTPRKCHVFEVCAEGSGKQTLYLVDEGESVGKGAESVASMAHHYFKNFGIEEKHAEVHFDNCCGQNKNNVILWYAMWRVLTGLHETIQYSMMVAGHTKFAPDWHFGVWKVKWRDSNAETMEDIANSVRPSSRSGHNIPQLIKDQERPVLFYKRRSFLSRYFKKLKHITKYHHFIVSAKYPSYVICKEYSTSEEIKISLLKQKPAEGLLPELADIPGLDPSRQWYLYEQIREYFISKQARDVVCPKLKLNAIWIVMIMGHLLIQEKDRQPYLINC